MNQSRVASRYALALYEQSVQDATLSSVIEEVRTFQKLLTESRDLLLFFFSPIVKVEQKEKAIRALFAQIQPTKTFQNFVLLLIQKNRGNEIQCVLEAFEVIYNERHNMVRVAIHSAFHLDTKQQEILLHKITTITGKKPLPEYQVDPALIGGFTVKIGDSIIDGSIKRQLELLRQKLQEGILVN